MMWLKTVNILSLILTINGLRVPVDQKQEYIENKQRHPNDYYVSEDADTDLTDIDVRESNKLNNTSVLVTHLTPPKLETHSKNPSETLLGAKGYGDAWYPIVQSNVVHKVPVLIHKEPVIEISNLTELPVVRQSDDQTANTLSLDLQPPSLRSHNVYFAQITADTERPNKVNGLPQATIANDNNYEPLTLTLTPPKLHSKHVTIPHSKRIKNSFVPKPIPIAKFIENTVLTIPTARPILKVKAPVSGPEVTVFEMETEENEPVTQVEHKKKIKEGKGKKKYHPTKVTQPPKEQITAESVRRKPYTTSKTESPAPKLNILHTSDAPDQRTEFRMHGMKGPHSYEFGYDTGKGKNRQFRYETRDSDGIVRGHYGYMDEHGKLRVVNYSADPKTGFQAETSTEKDVQIERIGQVEKDTPPDNDTITEIETLTESDER